MSRGRHAPIARMRREDPARFRELVSNALKLFCDVRAAAKFIGVNPRAFESWLHDDPSLRAGVKLRKSGQRPGDLPRPEVEPDAQAG